MCVKTEICKTCCICKICKIICTKYATNMQINMLNMNIKMFKKCRICKKCKVIFRYAEYVKNKNAKLVVYTKYADECEQNMQ